jgi:hypothetical protein
MIYVHSNGKGSKISKQLRQSRWTQEDGWIVGMQVDGPADQADSRQEFMLR